MQRLIKCGVASRGAGLLPLRYFEKSYGNAPKPRMPFRDQAILVVDDDDAVRAMISAILRDEGWAVLVATDGDDALRVVSDYGRPVAAVIADVFMPGLSGVELYSTLRGWYPGIRFLMISGYPPSERLLEATSEPRTRLLAKPFAASTLIAVLEDLLAQHAPPR